MRHKHNWPQVFQKIIITNSQYWFKAVQNDESLFKRESPQILKGLSYTLVLPQSWLTARDTVLYLAPHIIRQSPGGDWETVLVKAVERSEEETDITQIEFRLYLGMSYCLQGRLAEAQTCLEQALRLCNQHPNDQLWAMLVNQLAFVNYKLTNYGQSVSYCEQILAHPNQSPRMKAESLNIMGLVAYEDRDWDKALTYLRQSYSLYQDLDDKFYIAKVLTNQGAVLQRTKQWTKAEECYQQAIANFLAVDDQIEVYKTVMNLGNIFLMQRDYVKAIDQYKKALPVFKKYNYLVELAYCYNNFGLAKKGLKAWSDAQHYFRGAIDIWSDLNNHYKQANVLDNLGDLLIKVGEENQAKKTLEQAKQLLEKNLSDTANARLYKKIEERLTKLRPKKED